MESVRKVAPRPRGHRRWGAGSAGGAGRGPAAGGGIGRPRLGAADPRDTTKPEAELSEDDYRHMRKVAGYSARHLKQRPLRDVTNTRWWWSLMNSGHDPVR